MDVHGLHEVDGHEIVKQGLGAGHGDRVERAGLRAEALHGCNVLLALLHGESSPESHELATAPF
jgi:hypothetical protein